MTRTIRQVRSELAYLLYSRVLLIVGAVLAAGVVFAFVGSVSHAKSAHESFVNQVREYADRGISLESVLAQPVAVTRSNGQETIDNPLKYDFLELGKSVHAVQGTAMISTALDFVTFLVVPLLFLILGGYLANVDRRTRTSMIRGARERWAWVTAGKVLALAIVSLIAPVFVALVALLAGAIGSGTVDRLVSDIGFPLVAPTAQSPIPLQAITTAAIGFFFGVLGYAIGFVTRSSSWPFVLAAAALFALPFISAWDPRNLLAVVGSQVYQFWGQFKLRPPMELDTGTAIAALLGYLVAALLVVGLSARSVRLR